jgi:hypothetical protein
MAVFLRRRTLAEVANFVPYVTQFEPGESDSMCLAFCAAQLIKMNPPNEGNPHSTEDIDVLADAIYVATTGSSTASIPINIPQFHEILSSHGVKFETIGFDTAGIDAALSQGCPVVVMGHEYSFINMDGSSPYGWNTADIDHAVILSGLSGDNGYEVRDSANSGGNPAIYNKWAMSLFSATKIIPGWQTYEPGKGDFDQFFTVNSDGSWTCRRFSTALIGGNKGLYSQLSIDGNTLPIIGLPRTNELYQHETDGYSWSVQFFERGLIVYDPAHRWDNQPGLQSSYLGKYLQFQQYDPEGRTVVVEKISDVVVADINAVKAASDQLVVDTGVS